MKIVGVSGGLTAPSRKRALVEFAVKQARKLLPDVSDLIDFASGIAFTLAHKDAPLKLEQ